MLITIDRLKKSLTPTLRKIIGNTGWLFADRIIRMGVGIFVWVWIARYLGPKSYGMLSYAIAFVGLISPIATLGLDNIVIREIVKKRYNENDILGTSFVMRILGGVITFLVSLFIIFIIKNNSTSIYWLVGILSAATLFQAFDVIDLWFQSQVRSKYTVIAKSSAFFILTIVRVILINVHAGVNAFAWAIFVETILGEIGLIAFFLFKGKTLARWKINLPLIKDFLVECLPLLLSNAAILLYMKIDVILLGQMTGEKSVGIYSAATKVSEAFYFIATTVATSVFPVIIENSDIYFDRLKRLFRLTAILGYAIVIPLSVLSGFIIKIFGTQYLSAGPMLAVHAWATIFVFLGVAQGSWYIKEGKKGIYMQLYRTLAGAVINIILNIILIPKYEGLGAAIATVIAYSYVGVFSNIFNKKTRDIFYMQLKALLLFRFAESN
jgi:O-antigen/teichoic acid export membrane protein